jgi:YggT family protein
VANRAKQPARDGARTSCHCAISSKCGHLGRDAGSVKASCGGAGNAGFTLNLRRVRLPPCRPAFGAVHVLEHFQASPGMFEILNFISYLLTLYIYILIASAILSWLVAFNVVNTRNQFVAMIGNFLYQITEPLLRPIRNILPNLGGIDISPVILILIIVFIQSVVLPILARTLA